MVINVSAQLEVKIVRVTGMYRASTLLRCADGHVQVFGYGSTAEFALDDVKRKLRTSGWIITTKTSATSPTPEEGPH